MLRVLRTLLALIALAVVLVVFHRPLLNAAGRYLIVADPLEKADVIVVLSGGRRDERVRQAADLYRAGDAPRGLLSGGEGLRDPPHGLPVPQGVRRLGGRDPRLPGPAGFLQPGELVDTGVGHRDRGAGVYQAGIVGLE